MSARTTRQKPSSSVMPCGAACASQSPNQWRCRRFPDMSSGDLFPRDEVLSCLPARRAQTLLFLIESRTAHLVAQSRQAMELFLTDEAAKERELAFVEA